ncbi:MAG TPA: YeeE/YedE family protein, partial [Fibrobacteria bacterium]|nr:YeeE/YedE family protein [Fibrobacteria bacterium]
AFGLGWGLIGACPGPLFVLSGMGYVSVLVMLAAALGGAFVYGVVYKKLPH